MTARTRQAGALRAIFIVLVLLVQTVGIAYAKGLGSGPPLLDAFGNPLCITSGDHGVPQNHPANAPDECCKLACLAAAAWTARPADAPGIAAPRLLLIAEGLDLPVRHVDILRFHGGSRPRGPPLAS